ncbi:MAG: glycosyltransferase family 4 protein [Tepidisphaeraceae bacterium]
MKIVVAHNFYQQAGGEDVVFHAEVDLLCEFGHEVVLFQVHNDSVKQMGRLALLANTVWNRSIYRDFRRLLRQERPEVVHFHNTFPLVSPAAYYAAHAEGAAVVQTLHNFRLLCPGALFYRDDKVCTDCLGKTIPWKGVAKGCYRGSKLGTAVTAAMVAGHRAVGTWKNAVDLYIALTESARDKFLIGGLPGEKVVVKPNFVHPDPKPRSGGGGYAVFVGRLSAEKGVETLLQAWRVVGNRVPLRIIGDGPMADQVKAAVAENPAISWLGRRPLEEIYDHIGGADLVVQPSNCFETFGRVAIEAFAVGTPVVATAHGAMADVVGTHGRHGALFAPSDPQDLARQVLRLSADKALLAQMRGVVRKEFEDKYTGPQNHAFLADIYRRAIETVRSAEQRTMSPQPATGAASL